MNKYENYLGLGIAGNFALHLAQAGELEEFKDVITAEEAAPKGMFPFYLPHYAPLDSSCVKAKDMLSQYPLCSTQITLPNAKLNVQAEPEVGLICSLCYENGRLSSIIPTHFGAYNDCSIRTQGAKKISDKKNWGVNSKGFSDTVITIDKFENSGIMDKYNICSFLRRDDKLVPYGENVALTGYSYFHNKLTDWMVNQINTQEDFGPLEPLNEYVSACKNPTKAIVSIGATRYTEYGEKTFLKSGDEVLIAVYDASIYTFKDIEEKLQNHDYSQSDMSLLAQKVV